METRKQSGLYSEKKRELEMPTAYGAEETKGSAETTYAKTIQQSGSLWEVLYRAGLTQMNKLTIALDEIAPTPGFLVFLEIKPSRYRINDLEPYLFTAIDACTHLQLARYYLTGSAASAIDFLDFITQNFPFKIREIRTKTDACFTSSSMPQSIHRFTNACVQCEVLHSVTTERQQDLVTQLLSNLTFGGVFEGSVEIDSELTMMEELSTFLSFHNNHRSIPSLSGKTPIQKLQMFQGFEHIREFDPTHTQFV